MAPPVAIALESGTALFLITLVVLPIAAVAFATAGPSWREIGRGPFSTMLEAEADRDAELEAEVRQLVVARNERRLRQGQQPLDVEAETQRELADLIGSP